MEFTDLLEKVEKLKHNGRVRDRVNFIRSVQQGLCSIDDVGEYMLTLECSNVEPVTNDECEDAEPLAVPAIITVDTSTATASPPAKIRTVYKEANTRMSTTASCFK